MKGLFPLAIFLMVSRQPGALGSEEKVPISLLMPGVAPKVESNLCHSIKLNQTINIVAYKPRGKMPVVHHILLYGCGKPGINKSVWECGEMSKEIEEEGSYPHGPVCDPNSPQTIIYAWAMEAPPLNLPEGVAFRMGPPHTPFPHLVLQVHYKDVSPFIKNESYFDNSGVDLIISKKEQPKKAGIFLMLSNGWLPRRSSVYMDIACSYEQGPTIHPIAFRTHAHQHGKVVSGYVIKPDNRWVEIGRKDPQKPQMFYNVTNPNIVIQPGDIIAARCTMVNNENRDVSIGATSKDEMCNFYTMYYVDPGNEILKDMYCVGEGPPSKYWRDILGEERMAGMPLEANIQPGKDQIIKQKFLDTEEEEEEEEEKNNYKNPEKKNKIGKMSDKEINERIKNLIFNKKLKEKNQNYLDYYEIPAKFHKDYYNNNNYFNYGDEEKEEEEDGEEEEEEEKEEERGKFDMINNNKFLNKIPNKLLRVPLFPEGKREREEKEKEEEEETNDIY